MEEITIESFDGFPLATAYFPIEDPKGIVQIIHGSLEYKERYYALIEYLNNAGYSCIICDLRGHGHSVTGSYPFGHLENVDELINDQMEVTKYVKERNPGLPMTLIGHSLGSQLARCYIQEHDDEIDHLILSGVVNYHSAASMGAALTHLCGSKYGHRKFLLSLSGMPADKYEWISYNRENIEDFENNPLNGHEFTIGGYKVLFQSNAEIGKLKKYKCKNSSLKIALMSGVDDPITGGAEGLADSEKKLRQIGYDHVTNTVYDHMMHEIFNEYDKEKVYKDVVSFIES